MARDPSLLDSHQPTSISPAAPAIAHVQLRDLLICPREKGVVNYVVSRGIVEQDVHTPGAPTRVLSHLSFTPNSLTSLPVGQNDTLLAAGGQETEIHLSYHTPATSSPSTSSRVSRRSRLAWELEQNLTGSINNSVLLTSLSLTRSNESSVEPRVGISNNDGSIRLYDIPLRVQSARRKLYEVGQVRLDVPVNHSSISPDGRTLLSVGDSNKVYFHQITGGARISFAPITTLSIPPPDVSPRPFSSSSLAAAFSTAFSGDGTKFAVASQEGVVAVWDVRSTKPVKVFQTDKTRGMGGGPGTGSGGATGWLSDDPWEWTRGTKAPGWCVRSVKFNGGEGARLGKEVMAFTEHTSLVHIVDARTFETHDIIRVPALQRPKGQTDVPSRTASSSAAATSNWYRPTSAVRTSSAPVSTSRSTLESAAAEHQHRIRNRVRRQLPVSNARRTSGLSVSTSSAPGASSDSPPSLRQTRPATGNANPSSATAASSVDPLSPSHSSFPRWLPPTSHPLADQQRRSVGHPRTPSSHPDNLIPTSSLTATTSGQATTVPAALAARLAIAVAASRNRGLMTRRTASASNSHSNSASLSNSTGPNSTSSGSTPSIVQALGDAFRIPMPASAYSPPASIGDSTWRTLGGQGGLTPDVRALRRGYDTASSTGQHESDPRSNNNLGGSTTIYGGLHYQRETAGAGMSEDEDVEEDTEGIVVVPDLGDRDVESEVHALLAVHGISSRLTDGSTQDTQDSQSGAFMGEDRYEDYMESMDYEDTDDTIHERNEEGEYDGNMHEREGDGESPWLLLTPLTTNLDIERYDGEDGTLMDEDDYRMDVDEDGEPEEEEEEGDEDDEDLDLEFECASGGNSRSGSPSIRGPMVPSGQPTYTQRPSMSLATSSRRYGSHSSLPASPASMPYSDVRPPRSTRPSSASLAEKADGEETSSGHRRTLSASAQKKYGYYEDLDIAGICFDPFGERMYVAGVGVGTAGGGPPHVAGRTLYGGGYGGVGLGAAGEGIGVGAVVEWTVRGAEKRWWVDDGWM